MHNTQNKRDLGKNCDSIPACNSPALQLHSRVERCESQKKRGLIADLNVLARGLFNEIIDDDSNKNHYMFIYTCIIYAHICTCIL